MKTIELAKFGPVIPVIVIDRVEDAVPVASSLIEGGVKVSRGYSTIKLCITSY